MQKRKPGQPHKGWKKAAAKASLKVSEAAYAQFARDLKRPPSPNEDLRDLMRRPAPWEQD